MLTTASPALLKAHTAHELTALLLCSTHTHTHIRSPTEIVAFSDRIKEFEAINCNVRPRARCHRVALACWS
jgi:hypothetical protein